MKTTLQSLAFAVAAASSAAAFAESGLPPVDQRFEINAQPAAVSAALAVMRKGNVDAVFPMSSGRTLTVLSAGDAISVRYGQRPETTLRHDGQGNFVSQDRKVVLQFEADRSGDPQQARLLLPTSWK
jgi:hypothetical protein